VTAWAISGDRRHLAYENACALHGMLSDALNELSAKGDNVDLDDLAFVIDSESDVVLGEHGSRLSDERLAFSGMQLLAMAEMLGAMLPDLAREAHNATGEWNKRNEAAQASAERLRRRN
jgi:hypothetical protein